VYFTEPKITVLARPVFTEPPHLPVNWIGESTDGERLAEFAGRLCYMSQRNPAGRNTRDYLENIKRQGHGSVLEHANYSLLLEGVSRSLTHELVRHRAGFAYCLDGETLVYSERLVRGKRDGARKRRLVDLYRMTQTPHGRSRLRLLRVRCLDEGAGAFTTGRVRAVAYSGAKEVFEVTLDDGKRITCSRDHRFLSRHGWQPLDDLVGGIRVSREGVASVGVTGTEIVVNGMPAYRDRQWLEAQYCELGRSQLSIAHDAGVSKHTIRAWVRRFKLQKPLGSWTLGREPWNKGRRYRAGWKHNRDTRARLSAQKAGAGNPQWKGGVTRRGVALRRAAMAMRSQVFERDGYRCRLCGTLGGKLTLHHILPIWHRPDLADSFDNIATVCRGCHHEIASKELSVVHRFGLQSPPSTDAQRPRGGGRLLLPRYRRIVSVVYKGIRDTYDLEMEEPHHNFVANGIVTHNSQLSQRYVDESEAHFVVPPAMLGNDEMIERWRTQIESAQAAYVALVEQLMEGYSWVADKVHRRKMAREAARAVLPNSTETKIVATANARAWRTMLELRSSEGAELEIRRCAVAILRVLQQEAPAFFSDFQIYLADDRREAARITYHKV
jgi:thymidylate synthase ThyX